MEKITGREVTLNDLLNGKEYTIHYYQREYRWGKKQVVDLINDLIDEFTTHYTEGDNREKGKGYGYYYMGSVILTEDGLKTAIIDGQQRLTTITLLLIHLNHLKKENHPDDKTDLISLISSSSYGEHHFNLNISERKECLNALVEGQEMENNTDVSHSISNMLQNYQFIVDEFSTELFKDGLLNFIDWLIHKVCFVKIETKTDQDAHKVFVRMNDRGLSLTPSEMLKGYLLSKIECDTKRKDADTIWKDQIEKINNIVPDEKDLDEDFLKNWIRSQYAKTIRQSKKGAKAEDFDLIGTEVHNWVLTNARKIGLNSSEAYEMFILKDFKKFSDIYIKLRKYSLEYNAKFDSLYFNANRNFTLQYQLILSSIDPKDDEETIDKKIIIITRFVDQYITKRIVNGKSCQYSTIKNAVFSFTKDFRRLKIEDLKIKCVEALDNMEESLSSVINFSLNQFTKRYMLHMLVRITYFIDLNIRKPQADIEKYLDRNEKNSYDIEHIISNSDEEKKKFLNEEFDTNRNKFGALILLPKDKNRSLQAKPYSEKLKIYAGDNILAQSLDGTAYINNPSFTKFIEQYNLNFEPLEVFDKDAIDKRQDLYRQLVEIIWDKNLIYEI